MTALPRVKTKFPRADALRVAEELCDQLKDVCERLIVAGSLRRGAQEVGDVEILFIPIWVPSPTVDFFSPPKFESLAENRISKLVADNILAHRQSVSNHDAGWGPKNKLAVHVTSGMPVDLFETTIENWWVSLVIRTGPKDFNLKLTTGAQRQGKTLNAYGSGVTDRHGIVTAATSEQHVCQLCGVPYAEPRERR